MIKVDQGATKVLYSYLLYDEHGIAMDACDRARSASTSLYYVFKQGLEPCSPLFLLQQCAYYSSISTYKPPKKFTSGNIPE